MVTREKSRSDNGSQKTERSQDASYSKKSSVRSPRATTSSRSSSTKRPSSRGGRNDRNRGVQAPTNNGKDALLSEKPKYVSRHHVVSRDVGGVFNGKPGRLNPATSRGNLNLPVKSLGPMKIESVLGSNSPVAFDGSEPVRVIPMGGLNEVGLNMTAIEYKDDIIIIDTGFGFGGGDRWPGVDYIIPDTSYLEQNKHKIKGLIYTHGHLDHIGGAPYILPKLGNIPIFASEFTLELLKNRLQEFKLDNKFIAKIIDPDKPLKLGAFDIDFVNLNHTAPGTFGLAIDTPMGRIVYATDWKFDHTPFDNKPSDYGKLAKLGGEGVRLLMTDALGALKPGYTISEKAVEKEIASIFEKCDGRILLTTFASNVARMQHVINACHNTGRKLAIMGRSMVTNFNAVFKLGIVKVPSDLVIDIRKIGSMDPSKVCVLSTGSQGEDNAALSRMARDEHRDIKLQGGDSVIFSSSPVPGNETAVQDLMSALTKKGVDVYHKPEFAIHVSGHASQEDLKVMFSLTKPDYLQPIHGEHFMLKKAAKLGAETGIDPEHCLISANGRITEMRHNEVVVTDEVITDNYYLVDGSGVGAVSEVVLQERRVMNNEGALILVLLLNKSKKLVSGPEIISRGFVYMKNSKDLFEDIKSEVKTSFDKLDIDPQSKTYFSELRKAMRTEVSNLVYKKTEKSPMIIPVVVRV